PFTRGTMTVFVPLVRTRNPATQFAISIDPEYKPHNTPSLPLFSCINPDSMTTSPPNSTGSIAVNVVVPSVPAPPDIPNPPPLALKYPPESFICQIDVFKAALVNSSSSRVGRVIRNGSL